MFQVRVAGSKVMMMDVAATLREGKSGRNLPYGPFGGLKNGQKTRVPSSVEVHVPMKNQFFSPEKKTASKLFSGGFPGKHLHYEEVIGRR